MGYPGSVFVMLRVFLVVVLVVLVGGAVVLAGRDTTKPLTKIEKVVPDNALSQ